MAHYRLAPQAEQDIEAILAWTHEQFGEQARLRYEALLIRGIRVQSRSCRSGFGPEPARADGLCKRPRT